MGREDEYGQVVEQRAVGLAVGRKRLSVSKVMSWLLAVGLGLVNHYGQMLCPPLAGMNMGRLQNNGRWGFSN